MVLNIRDKSSAKQLQRNLSNAMAENADALEKLSSGSVFTSRDPRPADRAIAEGFEYKLRGLAAAKRNINDAVSLIQTGESGLNEITNMLLRMKEINVTAASTTVTDKERRYLFIEYQALFDEVNRIAVNTEFNGIPLLNGAADDAPEQLVFRVGDPMEPGDSIGNSDVDDLNTIVFNGVDAIVATAEELGIHSAADILADTNENEGITLDDANDLLLAEDDDLYATAYDQALETLAGQRSVFGALQARMNRAVDFVDVYQENLASAKSNIADTDFAEQSTRLIESRILTQAGTSLLAQSNLNMNLALDLLNRVI